MPRTPWRAAGMPDTDEPTLLELLAQLYPRTEDAVRIAAEVGVAQQLVDAHGTALDAWTSVLALAGSRGALPAIVAAAHREFPGQTDALAAALRGWKAAPPPPPAA